MPITKSESRRKRRNCENNNGDSLSDSPKRTKVHAQRKFAQGSALVPPIITHLKEIEKEKSKPNDTEPVDLLPSKRPNTEDFLTFLCFRGTNILPPSLDFFHTASHSKSNRITHRNDIHRKTAATSSTESHNAAPDRPFVAFGVRKRADPFVHKRIDQKRRHKVLAGQPLRSNLQKQRIVKLRAVDSNQRNASDSFIRTRSASKIQQKVKKGSPVKKSPPQASRKKASVTVKRKMQLRNVPKMRTSPVKQKRILRPTVTTKKNDTSSEFSSDDNQPLLKSVKVVKKVPKQIKESIATVTTKSNKNLITRTKAPATLAVSKRCTRSSSLSQPSKLPQRPSRKTKEAAALYMEMLGRKLSILENEPDDETMSIDSFPELPNVKRAVQRENEIRAQVNSDHQIKTRRALNKVNLVRKVMPKSQIDKPAISPPDVKKAQTLARTQHFRNLRKLTLPKPMTSMKKEVSGSSESLEDKRRPKRIIRKNVDRIQTRMTLRKPIFRNKISTNKQLQLSRTKKDLRAKKEALRKSEPEEVKSTLTSSKIVKKENSKNLENKPKEKKIASDKTVKPNFKLSDQNFSDSDEEPLACKIKSDNSEKVTKINLEKDSVPVKDVPVKEPIKTEVEEKVEQVTAKQPEPEQIEKQPPVKLENEPTKSSDDTKEKNIDSLDTSTTEEPPKLKSGPDLLCKDIGRHFGKGKVNMSTEQIEKWLNDADKELKKGAIQKSDSVEALFKLDEKPSVTETEIKLPAISPSDESKNVLNVEKRSIFQQRRPIINKAKERKEKTPSTAAFSPDNESSVYAFEESETPVNTPFRRHCRRPSSTATSKSEDEIAKFNSEEESKKTPTVFRIPPVLKQDMKNISSSQPLSLTLNADNNPNQCTSIAVQVDLTDNVNKEIGISSDLECTTATEMADDSDGHLFYIPLQTGKQLSSDQQVIQGVAVKLGTTGSSGSNQRVIMQAKLVTKSANNPQTSAFTNKSLLPTQSRPASVYPPIGTVQPFRTKPSEAVKPMLKAETITKATSDSTSLSSDDAKIDYKPSTFATASSSNTILNKRVFKSRPRGILESSSPSSTVISSFPNQMVPAQVVEAPTFHPTDKEFQDPLEFIDKIRPLAESFGLCRIVPPQGFKPECKVSDDMRFTAYNQYVHKMLYRWGPNFRELTAIKKYLATQNITLNQAPWIGGMEVDLPRLYQTVQSLGGLKEVIEKKKWPRVAEIMRIPKSAQDRVTKLDDIYCKYLLPYDTLSTEERQKLLNEVDTDWEKQQKKVTQSPSYKDDNDVSSEADSDDGEDAECIVRGRSMALSTFYRIARNTMSMWFKTNEPSVSEVEYEFWKHVNMRTNHLCVHSGSIDSGGYGYGFVCSKNSPFARHPWNLKVLTNNPGSILRSMGPIMGVTVPTLHVGMVFSACCWYRDPHGLPWIEYLHTGASKVWYGIPDSLNEVFRQTLNKLVPNVCRKTPVWLPSDTAMIPPSLLVSNNVSLCRTVQEPGQYIVIFPKAFTSSLCTGYTVSESVFFAQPSWLEYSEDIFAELKESCEPSMFSLERLLLSMALDTRCTAEILKRILPGIQNIRDKESIGRDKLRQLGVTVSERLPQSKRKKKKADTDGEYLCEVCKSNLYVSLVTEIQDDEVFCLQHAAEHISNNKILTKDCKLMYTYTEEELCEIVEKVINAIDTKYQKKSRPNL